jgi:aminoglycoside 6'-N-acetyltransferase
MTSINFKPLTESDLPLLHDWFQKPHIKKWYARGVQYTFDMIKEKYLPRILNSSLIPNFIVYADNVPIGYIQLYCLKNSLPDGVIDYNHPLFDNSDPNEMAGIDLFIADENYLKKGYASVALENFIKEYIQGKFTLVVTDPLKSNKNAIQFFENNKFKKFKQHNNDSATELMTFQVMTHLWTQTININEEIARELIETQHHFSVEKITLLDEGWDNLIYLVNENRIFRFPRRELGVFCIENEIALLPYIAKFVSFPLSAPQWIGKPTELYPYPFAGYTIIPGKPLCDASSSLMADNHFAIILATWLKELHAIKVPNDYIKLIKGDQDWRLNVSHRVMRCEQNITQYEKYFLQAGFEKQAILDVVAFIRHLKFRNQKRSFLHGDLYSRHIIVNPETVMPTGLIDWGDIHIGHPGIDLAVGTIFDSDTLNVFLETYGNVDSETVEIMLFHSFCHSMSFLPYAYEQNKESLKQWAAMVLARSMAEIKKIKSY